MILGPHGKLISDAKHSYCQGPFSTWVLPDTYLHTLRHFGAKVTQRISWKESISEETHKRSPISGGREDEKMEYLLRSYRIGTSVFIYFARAIVATRKNSSAKYTNREAPPRRAVYSEANARRTSFKSKLPTVCSFSFSCSSWRFRKRHDAVESSNDDVHQYPRRRKCIWEPALDDREWRRDADGWAGVFANAQSSRGCKAAEEWSSCEAAGGTLLSFPRSRCRDSQPPSQSGSASPCAPSHTSPSSVPYHRVQIPCISLQQQVIRFRACKRDASNYGEPLYLLWAFELHFFLSLSGRLWGSLSRTEIATGSKRGGEGQVPNSINGKGGCGSQIFWYRLHRDHTAMALQSKTEETEGHLG